jgi:hypothetical protein
VRDHVVQIGAFPLHITVGIAEDNPESGPPYHLLRAAQNEAEEGISEIGDDQCQRASLLPGQAAGQVVGDVAKGGDRRLDPLPRFGLDAGAVIDDAGDGHRGDAGLARDITDRE